jgi:hypothetical protein
MKRLTFIAGCALLTILTGCSESPAPTAKKKEAEKPPEPVSGLSALYKMYQVARAWAPDCEVYRMSNILMADVKPQPGKWGAWQATFVSKTKQQSRSYTFSVIEASETLHKGPFAGAEEAWSGPKGATKPFLIAAVKTDTDAAYETAMKKAADYEKKHPGKTITYLLEKNNKFNDPVWRVVWGESVGTSDFSVYVDAITGGFLEVMR